MSFLKIILTILFTSMLRSLIAFGGDQLTCITDREVYVSGESIMVNILVPAADHTKTVYVDLAGFSGKHIAGAKLPVVNHRAEGMIMIPDSVKTNTYLLRTFYTQNRQKKLHLRDLLIANRFEDFTNEFSGSMKKLENESIPNNPGIAISVPDTMKRREKGLLRVTMDPSLNEQIQGPLTVAISRHIAGFQSGEGNYSQTLQANESELTENKGLMIAGKVINQQTNLPVSDATVYLSLPDSIPGFGYYQTHTDGRFYFLMKDIYGSLPVIIQAFKEKENDQLKVVLDEKFNFKLPDIKDKSLQKEVRLAEELKVIAEAFTFSKIFNDQPLNHNTTLFKPVNTLLFYGKPTYVVKPDEFYDLTNFTEISRELLSGVKFRDKNGQLSLNIFDPDVKEYFEDQAFVLLDGIPVDDLELIKNMGSSQIDWIHTVLEHRFFGDITFPGVLAIQTKEKGFKWLKETDRLIKYQFEGLQIKQALPEVKISTYQPDMRCLLGWNPAVTPSPAIEFDFITSDIKGEFKITVTGKLKNGEIIRSVRIIHIN